MITRLQIVSLVMLSIGLTVSYLDVHIPYQLFITPLWYLIAFLPVGGPVIREAYEAMREKDYFNEFSLMTLASLGAFYIGEYPEGVAVMLFYAIGENLQEKAVDKARGHIEALLKMKPDKVCLIENDTVKYCKPEEVSIGSVIEVRPGEKIPLDGKLMSDETVINTAALTGESVPRFFKTGDVLCAGMIPTDSCIRLEVTQPYDQSYVARIIQLVKEATERKAPTELLIRKMAHVYTPTVLLGALFIVAVPFIYSLCDNGWSFLFDEWLYKALLFIVISCPCALVVSIPLSYFGGIGAASRLGILFKGSNYLDAVTQIRSVVFDKTGTLTEGVFAVGSVIKENYISQDELIVKAASLEKQSTHPLAQAICTYASDKNLSLQPVCQLKEKAGYGLKGLVGQDSVIVGNVKWINENAIVLPDSVINEWDASIIYVAINENYAGMFLLNDQLKTDVPQTIQSLRELGVENISILSGDKQQVVSKLGKEIGVNGAYGELLPEDKIVSLQQIQAKTTGKTAFVGDGLNDAPVLAVSDIGIAMGKSGSDLTIETADIIIQNDQLSKIATAIRIGHFTRKIVWQNIAMALGFKIIIMILGLFDTATLWEAVFADSGVALLAVLNALRIQKQVK